MDFLFRTEGGKCDASRAKRMSIKKDIRKNVIRITKYMILLLLFGLLIELFRPTWTPKISGDNSISELRSVMVNGTELEVMIRGVNKNNPIVIFVHGGPCCSEIPYIRRYQEMLEQNFTIVHYDQRGSGKSYRFGTDYSEVTVKTHVEDLIELTEYIESYLGQEKVVLVGHSFGTYIATLAAFKAPEKYAAYVGIGQMSDTIKSESYSLTACMEEALAAGNEKDYERLHDKKEGIANGQGIVPRQYIRKYGMAARLISEDRDYFMGFLFGTEYNLLDAIRFYTASIQYQDSLITEALEHPLTKEVTNLNLPVYFVMGKYDGMTSPKAAEEYLDQLNVNGKKQLILYENSAHYPQLEEKEKFFEWMKKLFVNEDRHKVEL